MARVWRIESDCGLGPYMGNGPRPVGCYTVDYHPDPYQEGLERWLRAEEVFGCVSRGALRRWFGRRARRLLHAHGYYVSVYDAEVKWRGALQCVFEKNQATLVGSMSLRDL